MWLYRKSRKLEAYITNKHFNYMAFGLVLLAMGYGYFTFSEYITDWYNQTSQMSALLGKFLDLSEYGALQLFHVLFTMVVPLIVLGLPWFRSINSIALVSVFIVLALWVKRYLIVVPPLETPFIPIQDIRPDWVQYSMSWVEITMTISGMALIVLIFTIASKLAPIIPVAEVEDVEDASKPIIRFKTKGV
jgi:molybdopterin-containing oxidoreductase family membrane subunit